MPRGAPSTEGSRADDAVPAGYRVAAAYAWRFVVIVAALALVGHVLIQVSLLAISLALALLVSALLAPVAGRLRHWGVPRGLAAAGAFIGGLGVIGLLGWFIVDQIRAGFADLAEAVTQGFNDALTWLEQGPLQVSAADIDRARESLTTLVQDNTDQIAARAVTAATIAAEVLAGLAVLLFTVFFFLYDGERIWGWVVRLFPRPAEHRADMAGRRGWSVLVSYAQGTVLVALFDGIFIGVGLAILGVPLAVPLGALVFLGAFVPLVGATLTGAVAVLVALAAEGFVTALLALGIVVLVQQVEGNVLQPFLLGRFVQIHPLAIVVAVTAGALVAGVIGALLAVPIMAVVNTMTVHLVRGEVSEEQAARRPPPKDA
jgi:predicted PurR-regulated permease PerM